MALAPLFEGVKREWLIDVFTATEKINTPPKTLTHGNSTTPYETIVVLNPNTNTYLVRATAVNLEEQMIDRITAELRRGRTGFISRIMRRIWSDSLIRMEEEAQGIRAVTLHNILVQSATTRDIVSAVSSVTTYETVVGGGPSRFNRRTQALLGTAGNGGYVVRNNREVELEEELAEARKAKEEADRQAERDRKEKELVLEQSKKDAQRIAELESLLEKEKSKSSAAALQNKANSNKKNGSSKKQVSVTSANTLPMYAMSTQSAASANTNTAQEDIATATSVTKKPGLLSSISNVFKPKKPGSK